MYPTFIAVFNIRYTQVSSLISSLFIFKQMCLIDISRLFGLVFALENFFLNNRSDFFTFLQFCMIRFLYFVLLIQFQLQSLLFQSLFMGQSFCKMMPFELWQVLEIPQILAVEVTFFANHFLPIQAQSSHLCNSLIVKLNPSLPIAHLFASSMFYPIPSHPFTLLQEINPLNVITLQQLPYIPSAHIRGNPRHVHYSFLVFSSKVFFQLVVLLLFKFVVFFPLFLDLLLLLDLLFIILVMLHC